MLSSLNKDLVLWLKKKKSLLTLCLFFVEMWDPQEKWFCNFFLE